MFRFEGYRAWRSFEALNPGETHQKKLFSIKKTYRKNQKTFLANQKNFFPIKKKLSLPVYRQA